MANPGKEHWSTVKWIFRYSKGSFDYGIIYGLCKTDNVQVEGFVYSDYADSIDTRKSITGYVFKVCGGVVSWKAGLQSVVSLSYEFELEKGT